MREFDFSPFSRSSIGFDRMFHALESTLRVPEAAEAWPPYNIGKTGEGAFRIELAVAGFTVDELTITAHQNVLIVAGKKANQAEAQYLYRGIPAGGFERRFSLADFIKVAGADYSDGILSISLVREVPEEMKPRNITINGTSGQQRTIEHKAA